MWDRLSEEDLNEAVTVARLIWLRRNASAFGRELVDPAQVVTLARETMEKLKSMASQSSRHNQQAESTKQWKPPAMGSLKMNWDAAICSSTKAMGVGAVLRDDKGNVRVACASVIHSIQDPTRQR